MNDDKSISEEEYARYVEWHGKRIELKPAADADGDGKLSPAEREVFKKSLLELNRPLGGSSEDPKNGLSVLHG